jgi:hypothetical protein
LRVELRRSRNPQKKLDAVIKTGHKTLTVPFGQRGAEDYTIHRDPARKQRYIERHRAAENWSNPASAGFWARWILWEKPSLREAVRSIERKFPNLDVKVRS